MIAWLSENRNLLLRLLGTLVATLLIVLLIQQEGWGKIVEAVQRITLSSFLLALISLLISRIFIIARWHILLQSGGVKIPFSRSAELTLMGLFANNFLPTTVGGDVVRLAGIMQMGFDRAICLASIAADRLVGMAGMMFTVPFGLVPAWGSLQQIVLHSFGFDRLSSKTDWLSAPNSADIYHLASSAQSLNGFHAVHVREYALHLHLRLYPH